MNIGRHLAVLAVCALCAPLFADRGPHTIVIRTVSPEAQMRECWERGDHAGAIEAIDRALRSRPNDALLLYNKACAKAQLGELDAAAKTLLDAVRNGFNAFSHMQRDDDLLPLREHDVYRAIMSARAFADELLADRRLIEWRDRIGDSYTHVRDENNRFDILHARDDAEFANVQRRVESHLAFLNHTLFNDPPAQWTLLILPQPGDDNARIGRNHAYGSYRHHRRELIALDTDRTLRHELVHLLHHRHMDELGQQHPIWIQEGLAALFERYHVADGAGIAFMAGDRQNIAKRLLRDDRLLPWGELMAMSDQQFNQRSHITYAQVDSIVRFIDEAIGVGEWYRTYVEYYDADSSGDYAIERQFRMPLDEVEAQWRAWLDRQPFIVR